MNEMGKYRGSVHFPDSQLPQLPSTKIDFDFPVNFYDYGGGAGKVHPDLQSPTTRWMALG